ncbi:MAG: zinc ABC transporter substrate-binding protein [Gammaproteobacteria bacterium]|nr:zinc ABC transporter substrate-binding protein [Gammaproteobacteria bacterium]
MRLLILLLCLPLSVAIASPRVVTSILPLHEITSELMIGITNPDVIIKDHASAHHFAFKPSHMKLLQQADLVIWIDRHFESGFTRMPEIIANSALQLELMSELGIGESDGHIWYSPRLLLRSIEIISSRLQQLDPLHQTQYRGNAERLSEQIKQWHLDEQSRWQNLEPHFITDHAFSSHFDEDMGFAAIATIHDQHDTHGGLKQLNELENRLQQNPATCLLTLEDPPSPLARNLAQKYQIRIVNVALMPASKLQPQIIQRLEQLARALRECI